MRRITYCVLRKYSVKSNIICKIRITIYFTNRLTSADGFIPVFTQYAIRNTQYPL